MRAPLYLLQLTTDYLQPGEVADAADADDAKARGAAQAARGERTAAAPASQAAAGAPQARAGDEDAGGAREVRAFYLHLCLFIYLCLC